MTLKVSRAICILDMRALEKLRSVETIIMHDKRYGDNIMTTRIRIHYYFYGPLAQSRRLEEIKKKCSDCERRLLGYYYY